MPSLASADSISDSCVLYLRYLGVNLPHAAFNASDMAHVANDYAHVGAVAIFYYPVSGEYHVALVTGITSTGLIKIAEANFHKGQIGTREISPTDPAIIGYWSSSPFAYLNVGGNSV